MGWLNIFSAVYSEDHATIFDLSQRYGKQFVWICAALVLAILILAINSRFYEFFAYPFYIFSLLLLFIVLIAGKEINASKSWFAIGNFHIQPSEFAKPAVALALARYISTYNLNIKKFKTLAIAGGIIIFPAFLILLQPDTGSALVFFTFIFVLYREGFSWLLLLIAFLLILLFFLVLILSEFALLMLIIGAGLIMFLIINQSFKFTFLAAFSYFLFFMLFFGLNKLLGYQPDLYKTGLIALIPSVLIYFVLIRIYKIKRVLLILACVIFSVVYTFAVDYGFDNFLTEYQQHRVNIMLGLISDPLGAGYNVNQSKIAIGSGGFSGKGFLNGTQTKLSFVPEQSTDFIFCTVGEEWGFLGTLTVVGLFAIFLMRLIVLAERQRTTFGRVYGYGVFSVFFIHIVVNIAMTIGLFPVIGIPLPFFSYGGSSLWAFTIILFIFLRLDASRKKYIL